MTKMTVHAEGQEPFITEHKTFSDAEQASWGVQKNGYMKRGNPTLIVPEHRITFITLETADA